MRHKYETRGIVLARAPAGEANVLVTLSTPDLGMVRARAQGARAPGAKLSAALVTFAESELVLVRGKEAWRVAGAVLHENWFRRIPRAARPRAARIVGLLIRLTPFETSSYRGLAGESSDAHIFSIVAGFFKALSELPDELYDTAEILAALRIVALLGLSASDSTGEAGDFSPSALATIIADREHVVARINRGLEASGL